MLQSKIFTKTRKEAPKDEVSKNAQFLVRGGFIHKEMAGVYSYLPLGLRVLRKIENIIREEMELVKKQNQIKGLLVTRRRQFKELSSMKVVITQEGQELDNSGENTIDVVEESSGWDIEDA